MATPPNGIPCKKCGKKLHSGELYMFHTVDVCPHCGQEYGDSTWKESDQGIYEYRVHNDINVSGNPIFIIQRRESSRHHVGNWKNYSLRVFQENEREEAERILKHLQGK